LLLSAWDKIFDLKDAFVLWIGLLRFIEKWKLDII
jgi:hypothetical protein